MRAELVNLAESYRKAGDAMHDAIRDSVRKAGGFLSCINNDRSRKDMNVLVYDSKKKYSESFSCSRDRFSGLSVSPVSTMR